MLTNKTVAIDALSRFDKNLGSKICKKKIYFRFSEWHESDVNIILKVLIGWVKLVSNKSRAIWTKRLVIDADRKLFLNVLVEFKFSIN